VPHEGLASYPAMARGLHQSRVSCGRVEHDGAMTLEHSDRTDRFKFAIVVNEKKKNEFFKIPKV